MLMPLRPPFADRLLNTEVYSNLLEACMNCLCIPKSMLVAVSEDMEIGEGLCTIPAKMDELICLPHQHTA